MTWYVRDVPRINHSIIGESILKHMFATETNCFNIPFPPTNSDISSSGESEEWMAVESENGVQLDFIAKCN